MSFSVTNRVLPLATTSTNTATTTVTTATTLSNHDCVLGLTTMFNHNIVYRCYISSNFLNILFMKVKILCTAFYKDIVLSYDFWNTLVNFPVQNLTFFSNSIPESEVTITNQNSVTIDWMVLSNINTHRSYSQIENIESAIHQISQICLIWRVESTTSTLIYGINVENIPHCYPLIINAIIFTTHSGGMIDKLY